MKPLSLYFKTEKWIQGRKNQGRGGGAIDKKILNLLPLPKVANHGPVWENLAKKIKGFSQTSYENDLDIFSPESEIKEHAKKKYCILS